MRAVRFLTPGGAERIGRLEGERVVDAGAAGPAGFVPTPEAWRSLAEAAGPGPRRLTQSPSAPRPWGAGSDPRSPSPPSLLGRPAACYRPLPG